MFVRNNIRYVPEMPVIDDHPFHIIIRGYGVNDQFEDIFTLLCNYAGIDAYYEKTDFIFRDLKIDFCSFVKIGNHWTVCNLFHGISF